MKCVDLNFLRCQEGCEMSKSLSSTGSLIPYAWSCCPHQCFPWRDESGRWNLWLLLSVGERPTCTWASRGYEREEMLLSTWKIEKILGPRKRAPHCMHLSKLVALPWPSDFVIGRVIQAWLKGHGLSFVRTPAISHKKLLQHSIRARLQSERIKSPAQGSLNVVTVMSSLNSRRTRSSSSFATADPSAHFQAEASGRDGGPLPTSAATATGLDHRFNEEMDEIKRYEDFTTIDWVQDAAREQLRRRARRKENGGSYQHQGRWGVRRKVWELYDAGQAWIVVTFVGAAIGLNAAFLNIVTEWLSDVKRGHCSTAFYLNENFCCWGAEDGTWQR